jgi:aryl-alcohol dehydrogenase-like predicted oxidoreductase
VRTRPLGRTGLRVSELSLGTWGLSGDGYGFVDAAEARKVIERALEIGCTTFDTADAYGAGAMERLLGEVIPHDVRDATTIVTKVGTDRTTDPPRKRFEGDYLRASAARSLKRLGRDAIDVYLLHNPSADCLAMTDATDSMKELKKDGLIRHWGVSAGDVDVARLALQKGAEVVELAYNLLQSTDLHRLAGELMISRAGVLARSTLGYGLLAGMWPKDREFAEGDHRQKRWTKLELERRVAQLETVKFLVRGDVHTMRAASVRFVLANNLVSSAVLGPKSIEQLEQLVREVGAGPVYLKDDDLAQLPRALERVGIET